MQDRYKKFDLTDKIAVITGASEGIGRDMAIGLAEAGVDVIICSRREEKLLAVKKSVEKTGRTAEIYVLDLQKVSEIAGLKSFIKTKTDKVDILINNAGHAVTKPAWDVSENDWDAMVDTGFKGLFFCCQAVGSIMRGHGYGKIINLSSTFSKSIVPGRAVYAGIKAGIDHLTEALAMEWAPHGIRVNALAPTAVSTPSRQVTLQGPMLAKVLSRIPLGRLATPDDLMGAVIYLSSAASDFVTGQTLFVDGGWVAAS
ncbi:3-oxoacyl-[acyl-carrier protein] reductase [hydrothermal vent metagenome]|uniref:3-oxoacyl-[acyl-carrier protein] reductase n=1 Tax=hydrothermal vent metagenome TaxID=652676 RepID=A0A3B0VM93_9ZZZZ